MSIKHKNPKLTSAASLAIAAALTTGCSLHKPEMPTAKQQRTVRLAHAELMPRQIRATSLDDHVTPIMQVLENPANAKSARAASEYTLQHLPDATPANVKRGIIYMNKAGSYAHTSFNDFANALDTAKQDVLMIRDWLGKALEENKGLTIEQLRDDRSRNRAVQATLAKRTIDYAANLESERNKQTSAFNGYADDWAYVVLAQHEALAPDASPELKKSVQSHQTALFDALLWKKSIAGFLVVEGMYGKSLQQVSEMADDFGEKLYHMRPTALAQAELEKTPEAKELLEEAKTIANSRTRNWRHLVGELRCKYQQFFAQKYSSLVASEGLSAAVLLGTALYFDKQVSETVADTPSTGVQLLDIACGLGKSQVPGWLAVEAGIRDGWTLKLHDTLEGAYDLVLKCKTDAEQKGLAQKLYGIVDTTYLLGKDPGIYQGNKAEPKARLLLGLLTGMGQIGGFFSSGSEGSVVPGVGRGSGARIGGSSKGGPDVGAR